MASSRGGQGERGGRGRGLVLVTVAMLAALATLISLGVWQLRRLAWKEDLIARIEAAAKAAPVPVGALVRSKGDRPPEFTRVSLAGRFMHELELHLWAPDKDGPGWRVVTPLRLERPLGGGRRYPTTYVLVVRGRVPDAAKDPARRAAGQPTGPVSLVGRVRYPSSGPFTPEPNLGENRWYATAGMREHVLRRLVEGSASGTIEEARGLVAPFHVEAETAAGGPAGPQPAPRRTTLPNRHLEYALTWFGLAAVLVIVWAVFLRGRLRGRP